MDNIVDIDPGSAGSSKVMLSLLSWQQIDKLKPIQEPVYFQV